MIYRSSPPEMFLRKDVLKICCKFTGEHPCQNNFIEIVLRHGCSPVNLQHIFRTPFPKNTSGGLLLDLSVNLQCDLKLFANDLILFSTVKIPKIIINNLNNGLREANK